MTTTPTPADMPRLRTAPGDILDLPQQPLASRHHDIREWPDLFEHTWTGARTFEIRWDDRAYQRGDTVTIHEFNNDQPCSCDRHQIHQPHTCQKYTGRNITARIGHVTATQGSTNTRRRPFNGSGYVVFSLLDLRRQESTP